ncbi:polysaccharide deacetylase family protein [Listeria rocourtiae]|uniref:polysaccharide deacetylase family protein n=1 Tax=Listeria rocourtiae TaxID=647910 RepID=UPI0003E87397|nr:polysaccharide deacetylase [Listeria rocourtiae FSL F6-920]
MPHQDQAPKKVPTKSKQKIAYLTIDDGPTKYLTEIVAALKKRKRKSHFFSRW